MMISPAYAYEKAPDQEHFLATEQTRQMFRRAFAEDRKKVAPQPLSVVPRLPGGEGRLRLHGMGGAELFGVRMAAAVLPDGGRVRRRPTRNWWRPRTGTQYGRGQGPPLRQLHGPLRLRADGGDRHHGQLAAVVAGARRTRTEADDTEPRDEVVPWQIVSLLAEVEGQPPSGALACNPAALKEMSGEELADLAARDQALPGRSALRNRRPSGVQPRCGGADAGPAPGLRIAFGRHHLGHRPPGVRAQDRHRQGSSLHRSAPGGGPFGLPEPGRVGPRPGREQPRLHGALLRLRDGPGADARRQPPTRGGSGG